MKTKIIKGSLFAIAIILQSVGLKAQTDTVIVHDTIKEKQIVTTVHDTVPVYKAPEKPALRRGEFGLRYMPSVTYLSLNTYNGTTVSGTATVSHGYGAMAAFNFTKNIGLQAGVNYNEISQKYKDRSLEREVHINYINVPVLLSLNTDKTMPVNFNVVVGPQFGVNVGSSTRTNGNGEADTLHAVLAVKQNDVGVAYGAGFEFALNKMHTIRFDLGFRGFYGLVDINAKTYGRDTYNILINGSRKSAGGYAGFTIAF